MRIRLPWGRASANGPVLTLRELERQFACSQQRELFQRRFGKSVVVTEELALQHARTFDFAWACEHLLKDWGAVLELKAGVARELGMKDFGHGYPGGASRCPACVAERRVFAVVFARRLAVERGA
jgi:hypothetical protein